MSPTTTRPSPNLQPSSISTSPGPPTTGASLPHRTPPAVSPTVSEPFEDVLTDAGLSTQHDAGLRDDGLDEATEDIDSLDSGADVTR